MINTGTSVSVYGTIEGSVSSSYSVDGSLPIIYKAPDVVSSLFRQKFFEVCSYTHFVRSVILILMLGPVIRSHKRHSRTSDHCTRW
jgi:hypothetical protein